MATDALPEFVIADVASVLVHTHGSITVLLHFPTNVRTVAKVKRHLRVGENVAGILVTFVNRVPLLHVILFSVCPVSREKHVPLETNEQLDLGLMPLGDACPYVMDGCLYWSVLAITSPLLYVH